MTPERLEEALRARFPTPYSLTFRQVAEAVLEILGAPSAPVAAVDDDGAITPEQAKKLLEEIDNGFMGKKTLFAEKACQHCGGVHVRKCPAVKQLEYHPDGKVKRVVYYPHGQWPADEVLWLEDVIQAAAQADDETP